MTANALTIPTQDELASYKTIATIAASNAHWKKLGGGGSDDSIIATILSVMLLARELGVSPMIAISGGINNIQGKFELSARIMNQLIRKQGHLLQVKVMNDGICTIWSKRKDTGEEMTVSFTMDEAKNAGLIKPGSAWTKTPQDMLYARAISRLARRMYPDCIGGCYVEGELQETVLKQKIESIESIDVEIKNETPTILQLPSTVDATRVELFIQESANKANWTIEDLKKEAMKNMDRFLSSYNKWEESKKMQQFDINKDSQDIKENIEIAM